MASASPPLESFYGRTSELGMVKRLIEQRVGAQIGFRGIGGIGKSALLAQIAAEARRLAVTPYIVSIALDEQMTPVGFYRKLLDGLRATGRTTRRRALILSEDTLRPCEMRLWRLEQQEIWLKKKVQTILSAADGGAIGNVIIELHEQHGVETTVLMQDLHKAFVDLVACQLPETVTVPPGVTGYRPGRLLILLVDNLERARPDVLEELRRLRSGSLNERVLLICAGRAEDRPTNSAAPHLLTCDLDRLDEASCRAWLTRSAVTDQALREAILRLCQGVPLLLRLCLHEVEQARAQGETLGAADFALPPPQPGGEASLHVVEEFLVERFIERLERGGAQGKQLSRLVRFGCVLPNFADRDAIRALQIDGLPDDLDPLIRNLGNRGMMSSEELHPVVRQGALARLARREPQRFRDYCRRAAAYYADAGRPVEALTIRLQAGEVIPDEEFAQQVAMVARAGDLALARRMVKVVEGFAPQRAELAWTAALARVDLARTTGRRAAVEEELVHAVALAGEQPERVAALEERVRALEQEQPLQNPILLLWWLPRQPDSSDVLHRLLELGEAFGDAYQYAEATVLLQHSLAMAQRLDDRLGAARALMGLGEALLRQAEGTAAQGYYQQALDIYRDIGDRQGEARALMGLGKALLRQADATAVQGYCQQVLYIGDWQGEARVLLGLGDALLLQSAGKAAQGYYQQALDIYRAVGDRQGEADALMGLGDALWLQSELLAAQGYYQQALDCYRAIGARGGEAHALKYLGDALGMQGKVQAAQEYFQQALNLARAIGDRRNEADALLGLGEALRLQGKVQAAQGYYQQALDRYRAIGVRCREEGRVFLGLGEVLRLQGDRQRAVECLEEALAIGRRIQNRAVQFNALETLIALAEEAGDHRSAGDYRLEYQRLLVEKR